VWLVERATVRASNKPPTLDVPPPLKKRAETETATARTVRA
jgi:hypothetical protein